MIQPQGHEKGEAPASDQRSESTGGSKVAAERWALLVPGALLAAAVIVIYRLAFHNIQTRKSFLILKDEYEAVIRNLTAEPCSKCPQGWELFGGRCYRFSTHISPWEKARNECRSQGGNLVQIDSRMEQSFLMQKVSEKMNNPEDMFWIGLTDSVEEGRWLWVDGSPLNTSLTFWYNTEPDNWTDEDPDGEDCARMGEQGQPGFLMCWLDKSCKVPHRHICEKQVETGRLKCV
nr:immune-related, lectin-like receptor 4 isoform X4 [Scatophagus argus]